MKRAHLLVSLLFALSLSGCGGIICQRYHSDLSEKSRVPALPSDEQAQALSVIYYKGQNSPSIMKAIVGFDFCPYKRGIYVRLLDAHDSMGTYGDGGASPPLQAALFFSGNQCYLFSDVDDDTSTDWVEIEKASPATRKWVMAFMLKSFYIVRIQECMQKEMIFPQETLQSPLYQKALNYVLSYHGLTGKDMPCGIIPEKYWTIPHMQTLVYGYEGEEIVLEPQLDFPLPPDIRGSHNSKEVRRTSPRLRQLLIDFGNIHPASVYHN